jgi:hypothetical protein
MKPGVQEQIGALKRIPDKSGYKERARVQMLTWAMGRSYHEPVNDECCPDFSCCFPSLFDADSNERWRQYRERYQTPTQDPNNE